MIVSFPRLNPITFSSEIYFPYEKIVEPFVQEFNSKDYIVFQITRDTDFTDDEITAYIIDCDGNVSGELGKSTIMINSLLRQEIFNMNCSIVKEGYYSILLEAPDKFSYYSNLIRIHNTDDTLLMQYRCSENKFDCIFKDTDGAKYFYLRIPGGIKTTGYSFKSDDIEFIDQDKKVILIDSIPYTVRKYTFGRSIGMPIWLADKLNRILACDDIEINGIKIVKSSGAALELSGQENYKYVGATIDLLYADEGYSEMPDLAGRIHIEEFTEIFN